MDGGHTRRRTLTPETKFHILSAMHGSVYSAEALWLRLVKKFHLNVNEHVVLQVTVDFFL